VIKAFWIPLLPPYLLGLALSWAMEALLTPRPVAVWRRPAAAIATHVGVWTLAFALELALFRRPYFGAANVLAIEMVIVLVSMVKYQSLREPFVYPDFEYFTDAIRHPRLYLPFFGVTRALAALGGYGAALWAGLAWEESVTAGAGALLERPTALTQQGLFHPVAPVVPFFIQVFGLAIVGLLFAILSGKRLRVVFDASQDLRHFGLVGALWAYGRSEKQPTDDLIRSAPFANLTPPAVLPDSLPDLVVIQSESFFDVRRVYPDLVRQDVLANFDLLKSEAVAHGQLRVDVWGANTVRTEFAFLSGMDLENLGVHKYNPYRKLSDQGFPTIASYLQSIGYRTVCVHPYYRDFYRRNEVLPMLGFDEFIGIEAFKDEDKQGAYIGDRALGDYVIQMLQKQEAGPVYIHVITMENHGPLHLESFGKSEPLDFLMKSLPIGARDFLVYLRHLKNADEMLEKIASVLKRRARKTILCFFGDHVPIMPGVYGALGKPNGMTDYFVWKNEKGEKQSIPKELQVSGLSKKIISSI